MGKFCHCRFMDIVHNSYNVGQIGQSEQFLYFLVLTTVAVSYIGFKSAA